MSEIIQRPLSGMSNFTDVSQVTQSQSNCSSSRTASSGPYLEGNLRLLDFKPIECPSDILCCRFSHDGSILAVGLTNGTIRIYDASTYQCLYNLADEDTQKARLPVTQIRFRVAKESEKVEHANILIATYASGYVKTWHYTSGKCLHTIYEPRQTLALSLNASGTRFVTAGTDAKIHVYDEETKQRISSLEASDSREIMNGHRDRVFTAMYYPDPDFDHTIITGGWDDTVQFWDDRKQHSVRYFAGPHICGDALDIDPVHNHVLTGSWRKDRVLQIWDIGSGKLLKDVPPEIMNSSQVYCCQWLGKDNILAGGSFMHMARVIDRGTLNTTGQLVDLPLGVYCLDNDRQGAHPKIAVCSSRFVYLLKGEKK